MSRADSDFLMAQFSAVFCGGTACVLSEAAVEGGQVIEAAAKSDICNGAVPGFSKQGLHCLNPFVAQIIVKRSVSVLFEQTGKMIFGKSDIFCCLFQSQILCIVGVDKIEQIGYQLVIFGLSVIGISGGLIRILEVVVGSYGCK